jgi:hypothetical protein
MLLPHGKKQLPHGIMLLPYGKILLPDDKKQPLFMYLSLNAPHHPLDAPQDKLDKYPLDKIEEYWSGREAKKGRKAKSRQYYKDGGIKLKFKNAETGLFSYDKLEGFEIAGKDKVFYKATAKIVKRMDVFVSSKEVPNPVAVRYAWRNWVVGTLYDINLLPASSFRTDKWDDATFIDR